VDGIDVARMPIVPSGTIPADVCTIMQQPGWQPTDPPAYLACVSSLGDNPVLGGTGSKHHIQIRLIDGGDGLAFTEVYLAEKSFQAVNF
jgi:hypothetical protein